MKYSLVMRLIECVNWIAQISRSCVYVCNMHYAHSVRTEPETLGHTLIRNNQLNSSALAGSANLESTLYAAQHAHNAAYQMYILYRAVAQYVDDNHITHMNIHIHNSQSRQETHVRINDMLHAKYTQVVQKCIN